MATVVRKAAPRAAKPAQRHFAKKGPTAAQDEDNSSEEEQEQVTVEQASDEEIGTFGQELNVQSFVSSNKLPGKGARTLKVALGNVNVKDGRVLVDGQADAGKEIGEER
jgi:microfibrillar-associated protein 1